MLNICRIDTRHDPDVAARLAELRAMLSLDGTVVSDRGREKTIAVFGEPLTPQKVVERICQEVRERGLDAVLHYTEALDGRKLEPSELRVPAERLEQAHQAADPEFLRSLRTIRNYILDFQTAILHENVVVTRGDGVELCERYVPLRRVGLCIPGGAAAYPSTVLMTAVPAQAAGVAELVVVAPPTPFGADNDDVLATCYELGIEEVYRVGGAQGVAALAYGVEGLPPVDMIVGPGNLFVALAKKYVYGHVDIDSIAGPSEVILIADESSDPEFNAADLLAQAEHSPGSSILITWSDDVMDRTVEALERQLKSAERGELARESLEKYGALIRVQDEYEACRLTDAFAPEHLHIATAEPESLLAEIRNAGAVFLGHYTPVAVGDYAAGPSHVLPTSGTARWASGLTANHFLRSHSVIRFSRTALTEVSEHVERVATKEGLDGHWKSVDIRVQHHRKES